MAELDVQNLGTFTASAANAKRYRVLIMTADIGMTPSMLEKEPAYDGAGVVVASPELPDSGGKAEFDLAPHKAEIDKKVNELGAGAKLASFVIAFGEDPKTVKAVAGPTFTVGGGAVKKDKEKMFEITSKRHAGRHSTAWKVPGHKPEAFFFRAGMASDYDGAPNAYHPEGRKAGALDATANAGHTGNWWGIVTDNGKKDGNPVVQGPNDPCPGFYVSKSALCDGTKKNGDPRRYVDASKVPYFSLPGGHHGGATMGDLGAVVNNKTQAVAYAIFADSGPPSEIGEGSPALGQAVGRHGHEDLDLTYIVFPGSKLTPKWPASIEDIKAKAAGLFEAWGGLAQLKALQPL